MKAAGRLLAMAAIAATAACAPRPASAPPVVEATPPPAPPPAPPPVEVASGWADRPLTPGEWRYQTAGGATEARFGGVEGLMLRCDLGRREVLLARGGVTAGRPLTIRTSSVARTLPDAAPLAASDPLLDAIAFSRGRFAVEAAGLPMLVIPAWPEPARVIEDCRS